MADSKIAQWPTADLRCQFTREAFGELITEIAGADIIYVSVGTDDDGWEGFVRGQELFEEFATSGRQRGAKILGLIGVNRVQVAIVMTGVDLLENNELSGARRRKQHLSVGAAALLGRLYAERFEATGQRRYRLVRCQDSFSVIDDRARSVAEVIHLLAT